MGYAIFEKKTPRLGTPVMSFSKLGAVTFNQAASHQFKRLGIKNVLLLWDSDAHKLALKVATNEKDPRSYVIRYNDKGNGASFSAKTFLDYAGINYSQRKPMTIEISPKDEFILEVNIPDALFLVEEKHQEISA